MDYKQFLSRKMNFSNPSKCSVKYVPTKRERKEDARKLLTKLDEIKKEPK